MNVVEEYDIAETSKMVRMTDLAPCSQRTSMT